MDLRTLTALELGALIKKKKVSSPEATRVFLDAARRDFDKSADDETKINAYTDLFEAEAMAQAEAVQERIDAGEYLSPLSGVPVALKDLICTKEGTTTAASKILGGFRAPYDAGAAERLKGAGAVILGKVNMDEFAMGGSTETSHYGITRNPWDTSRVPGGSSGGSAAAVAAGFAPYALGSDTGGSIRQPCSFCNLTGIKPTYGSVSRYGLMAYGSSLDQIGPLAKDARDCAVSLSIISGRDGRDSTSVMEEPFRFCDIIHGEFGDGRMGGLKIGVPANYFSMPGMKDDVRGAVLGAASVLRGLGADVEEFDLPMIDYAVPTYLIIACAEASSNLSRYDGVKYGYRSPGAKTIHDSFYRSRSEGFGTEVKRRIILGSFVLSSGYFDAYYKKALRVRGLIKSVFDEALEKYDIILAPVCPTVAYGIGGQIDDPLAMYLGDIYTTSVNLTGLPGAAAPCGFGEGGMPVGMQLIGKAYSEGLLLDTIARFQLATDYHKQAPKEHKAERKRAGRPETQEGGRPETQGGGRLETQGGGRPETQGAGRLCENAAVFASEAKQSIKTSCKPGLLGLPRRCAPRNDGLSTQSGGSFCAPGEDGGAR
ncbi:MAG: Asp-tRNA(Asn)/Glu-tRNA(Gln) amidotransferase subunit GatA [Clostridiales Family XIII bacterium]|jgi:aspartyl-tRNA(Asn)/glutamyl-tRNA(Gln) amidotransferase subunit A|nr:Asp-tRNA(Asn)/Glu-tRNA(Gln) amidotransferase subunit GatA [Clostridiales Family XIII bacterium]